MSRLIVQTEMRSTVEEGVTYVEGFAMLYDTFYTTPWGVRETIQRGALEGTDLSDVKCKFDHGQLIGRRREGSAKNTLELEARGEGLWFRAALPSSAANVAEFIDRGDVYGCSFEFDVQDATYEWEDDTNLDYHVTRKIASIGKIYDVGPVIDPAYESTFVETEKRSLAQAKVEHDKEQKPSVDLSAETFHIRARVAALKST